jgi:hypothetical protein
LADQVRRHLETVRRAGVERALVQILMRSPLAKDGAHGLGRCLGDVIVPWGVPVQERIMHMAGVERGRACAGIGGYSEIAGTAPEPVELVDEFARLMPL